MIDSLICRSRVYALGGLVLAFAAGTAFAVAADPSPPPSLAPSAGPAPALDSAAVFASLIASPFYLNQFRSLLTQAEPAPLLQACRTLTLIDASEVEVLDPPVFAKTAQGLQIGSGAWINRVIANRCGAQVKRRFYVHTFADKSTLDFDALLPGDFHGSLGLEHQAVNVMRPPLAKAAKCAAADQVIVTNVKADGPVKPTGWSEQWTASACGTMVTGHITYTAAAGGGTAIAASGFALAPQSVLSPGHP